MIINAIILILIGSSAFFFGVGTLGLIRMPDTYTRMHASTKCDTLGAGLALLALAVYSGFSIISVKSIIVIAFIWITNPTAAHIIAKAKYHSEKKEELQK
ncbi:monovalent cation/H(+) antiporter subunit G [Isachenkonia alkalipeptolytica]|uniref:Monovalent cation/H(+) antiporter subunit G n=1 Tax=Isachenkonia alkalipeptolytica TaxID=2565777 RepID=A0AA44BE20_9CLOT|nr:monovalent cation/H(+) antiporter subunit G [Isachenkonia alkalipeptolytica]NBG87011.1 monovalent cation/H(+) antiporter subunit G [Isachenkonia alkalipeptolytica]